MSLNAVSNKSNSDLSGQVREGLKRKDVQNSATSDSIFIDDNRNSTKVDLEHDGVLSQDDATADLRNELDRCKKQKYLGAASAVISTITALTSKDCHWLALLSTIGAAGGTVLALLSHDEQREIEKKLAEA